MPSRLRVQLYFILGAALLFLPGLGAVHLFDRDEINFAEITRQIILSCCQLGSVSRLSRSISSCKILMISITPVLLN